MQKLAQQQIPRNREVFMIWLIEKHISSYKNIMNNFLVSLQFEDTFKNIKI